MMPNGGPGSNPSSRRPSLRPPSPGSDSTAAQLQSRRGSRVLFDTKTPPSILRWEILNRVLALSVKGDWPAVDQHLNSLGRNNMEISSAEIESNDRYFQNVKNLSLDTLNRLLVKARLLNFFNSNCGNLFMFLISSHFFPFSHSHLSVNAQGLEVESEQNYFKGP